MAKQWMRWQDWAAVVLGLIAALSVLRLETPKAAVWSCADGADHPPGYGGPAGGYGGPAGWSTISGQ
jgi:hypothetical protein